jgi:hypothetical protein
VTPAGRGRRLGGSFIDVSEPRDCFQEGILCPGWPFSAAREFAVILLDISGEVSHDCIFPPSEPGTKSGSRLRPLLPLSARGQGCWRATLATGLGAGGDSLVRVLRRLRIAARDQEVVAAGLGRSLFACVITVWIAGSI